MTVVAISAAGNVCCVLACGNYSVVAGAAGTNYLCMVNRENRCPDIRVMAVLADVSRLDVSEIFAGGLDAVMAADAIANDAGVIEISW